MRIPTQQSNKCQFQSIFFDSEIYLYRRIPLSIEEKTMGISLLPTASDRKIGKNRHLPPKPSISEEIPKPITIGRDSKSRIG